MVLIRFLIELLTFIGILAGIALLLFHWVLKRLPRIG